MSMLFKYLLRSANKYIGMYVVTEQDWNVALPVVLYAYFGPTFGNFPSSVTLNVQMLPLRDII